VSRWTTCYVRPCDQAGLPSNPSSANPQEIKSLSAASHLHFAATWPTDHAVRSATRPSGRSRCIRHDHDRALSSRIGVASIANTNGPSYGRLLKFLSENPNSLALAAWASPYGIRLAPCRPQLLMLQDIRSGTDSVHSKFIRAPSASGAATGFRRDLHAESNGVSS
jgi:hypothetical protein